MAEFRTLTYPGWNEADKGQHGTELVMALIGSRGAFVWRLGTGISPSGPYPSRSKDSVLLNGVNFEGMMSMGLTAHSELDQSNATEDEYKISPECEFLEGRACVCDYQEYSGKEPMQAFACEGFDGVKKLLEKKYLEHYGEES